MDMLQAPTISNSQILLLNTRFIISAEPKVRQLSTCCLTYEVGILNKSSLNLSSSFRFDEAPVKVGGVSVTVLAERKQDVDFQTCICRWSAFIR